MGAARVSTEEVSLSDLALSGSQTCEAPLANLSSSLPCYKLPVPPFSGLDCADAAAVTEHGRSLAAALLLPQPSSSSSSAPEASRCLLCLKSTLNFLLLSVEIVNGRSRGDFSHQG